MIDWNFPKNDYGAIGGINESGVETFRGSQIKSLAREICQNSLDARVSEAKPVIVEFVKFKIKKINFPGRDTLEDSFKSCIEMWRNQQDKKTKRFFEQALTIINENNIEFVRISDFNTTGLTGSKLDFNSNWSNLVKGSGISDKAPDAGGSFGIGKSAPYACSALRTVFYSTMDECGEKAYQGVSRLVSFQSNDQYTQGQGYYGNTEKNMPVYDQIELDSNYQRVESGTDIYISGFYSSSNWKEDAVTAILDGFLLAIYKGDLIVKVDNTEISKDTLNDIIDKYGDKDSFTLIKEYYSVLISNNTKAFYEKFYGGHIELKVLENNDYHKKIAVTRHSGMKLFDKDRISPLISFAGILQLCGPELNNTFRSMENPQHDKWEPDRYSDTAYGKRIYNDLFKTIRELIRTLESNIDTDELDAEGLGEYLPEDMAHQEDKPENKVETISSSVTDLEIIEKKYSNKQNNLKENVDIDVVDYTEGSGDYGDGDETGKGYQGKKNIKNKGGSGAPGSSNSITEGKTSANRLVEAKLNSLRMMCKDKETGLYLLLFETNQDLENIKIMIDYSGEQGTRKAQILSAIMNDTQLKSRDNEIFISYVKMKTKYNIEVLIDSMEYYPMEVSIYGHQLQ